MAEAPVRKTSFHLDPEAKRKLESLKSDLRFDGYVGVSESAIIEFLVDRAKLADLKRHFKKRP